VSSRLVLATIAVPVPMGQQVYEEEVAARAQSALGGAAEVRREITRGLRADLPGTVRLPRWLLSQAPTSVRRAVGATLYRGATAVHRMGMAMPPARVPEIVTVHDTVAWRFDDESDPEPFAAEEIRRSAAVISPSRFAADDVAERLGLDHVHVVHNGVDERWFAATPLTATERRDAGLPERYVLHAGGSSTRKNLAGLAAAWPRVRSACPDVSLVLCGPPSSRRTEKFAGLDGTHLAGLVDADLLPRVVASAEVVVVPSVYEGFGLPALEAMACGVDVVAADRSSLPEVCGDAGILVEPDGAALADGIVHALGGDGRAERVARGRARARQFTWDVSAAAHARIWRDVLGV
jgi:glycosyltransferase involved in cell wall biosynthesis